MKLRKIGTFQYKGDQGLYVEAVEVPRDQPRYAAISYGAMAEAESRALDRGAVVESTVLDNDPEGRHVDAGICSFIVRDLPEDDALAAVATHIKTQVDAGVLGC